MKQYIWLGDTPLAVYDGATTLYYVHPDHLDRPIAMTNATAMTLAWQAKYEPFGNTVLVTATPVNTMRLPGQWFQIEDGLAYNWHRSYDPGLGRYSQADPLGFVDGPGIYNYAGQSPVMAIDRDGRYGIGGFLVGAGFNAAYQFGANYYTNGKNFWRALKCVDVLDVLISGGLGAVGLGVGGNLLKGNLRGAGLGGGLGVYLKVFMTPYPAKFGDKCECKKDPFFEPLNGLVQ